MGFTRGQSVRKTLKVGIFEGEKLQQIKEEMYEFYAQNRDAEAPESFYTHDDIEDMEVDVMDIRKYHRDKQLLAETKGKKRWWNRMKYLYDCVRHGSPKVVCRFNNGDLEIGISYDARNKFQRTDPGDK